jgi:hypothetical protein
MAAVVAVMAAAVSMAQAVQAARLRPPDRQAAAAAPRLWRRGWKPWRQSGCFAQQWVADHQSLKLKSRKYVTGGNCPQRHANTTTTAAHRRRLRIFRITTPFYRSSDGSARSAPMTVLRRVKLAKRPPNRRRQVPRVGPTTSKR